MMEQDPKDRPIFRAEEMRDLSIVGQIVMATANVSATAARLLQDIDVEALYFHCQAALDAYKQAPKETEPAKIAHVKLAVFRATRGLQMASAAIAFLKAYEELDRTEAP